jgi:hypothetical protein
MWRLGNPGARRRGDVAELRWQCTTCESIRGGEKGLEPTVAPGLRFGYCLNCNRRRTFRATTEQAEARAGAAAKERGMDSAETAQALVDGWVERADAELNRLAASGERFTAETLTGRVGMPSHPKAVGARFNAAAKRGLIRKVGFTRANRRAAHSRDLAVWQGVQA